MKAYKPKKISLRKMKGDARGISPIVATLMLVLITVAAATAFYMFESGWQKTATGNIGNGQISSTQLTMAGSTTVQDFMNTAVPAFEANNSGYKVSYVGTGSGAGLQAIKSGVVDMGMISSPLDVVKAGTTTDFPNLVQTVVAYDGVAIFMGAKAAAAHGYPLGVPINMTQALITQVYTGKILTWGAFDSAVNATGIGTAAVGHQSSKLVITEPTAAAVSAPFNVYFRSDSSGTQDAFVLKAMGGTAMSAASTTMIGESGNQLQVSAIMNDANGFGFGTYGVVQQQTSPQICLWNGVAITHAAVIDAVENYGATTGQYAVWHGLYIVTNGAPVTEVKSFIDWINDPATNQALCNAAGYTSIYQKN